MPSYPEMLIVSAAAANIAPTMEDKVYIIHNAVDLIILTSRADSVATRLASYAVAALVASVRRDKTEKAVA